MDGSDADGGASTARSSFASAAGAHRSEDRDGQLAAHDDLTAEAAAQLKAAAHAERKLKRKLKRQKVALALTCQRIFRGQRGRREVVASKAVLPRALGRYSAWVTLALTAQRLYRGNEARQTAAILLLYTDLAVDIQRLTRGCLARQRLVRKSSQLPSAMSRIPAYTRLARAAQALGRGYRCRHSLMERKGPQWLEWAEKQKWKGAHEIACRAQAKRNMENRVALQLAAARQALKKQAYVEEGVHSTNTHKLLFSDCALVQRHWREALHYRARVRLAKKLQAWGRGMLARKANADKRASLAARKRQYRLLFRAYHEPRTTATAPAGVDCRKRRLGALQGEQEKQLPPAADELVLPGDFGTPPGSPVNCSRPEPAHSQGPEFPPRRRKRSRSIGCLRERLPPPTMMHELREFYDGDYRAHLVRLGLRDALSSTKQNLMEAFHKFDSDGSGNINREELAELIRQVGVDIKELEVETLMRDMDEDGSGEVSCTEFCEWYLEKKHDFRTTRRKDEDVDEYSDVRLLRRESVMFHPQMQDLLLDLWSTADSDCSGSLDQAEYCEMHVQLQRLMNTEVALDEHKMMQMAVREWEFDSRGKDALEQWPFQRSFFQLTDSWCSMAAGPCGDIHTARYVRFLKDLLSAHTRYNSKGKRKWTWVVEEETARVASQVVETVTDKTMCTLELDLQLDDIIDFLVDEEITHQIVSCMISEDLVHEAIVEMAVVSNIANEFGQEAAEAIEPSDLLKLGQLDVQQYMDVDLIDEVIEEEIRKMFGVALSDARAATEADERAAITELVTLFQAKQRAAREREAEMLREHQRRMQRQWCDDHRGRTLTGEAWLLERERATSFMFSRGNLFPSSAEVRDDCSLATGGGSSVSTTAASSLHSRRGSFHTVLKRTGHGHTEAFQCDLFSGQHLSAQDDEGSEVELNEDRLAKEVRQQEVEQQLADLEKSLAQTLAVQRPERLQRLSPPPVDNYHQNVSQQPPPAWDRRSSAQELPLPGGALASTSPPPVPAPVSPSTVASGASATTRLADGYGRVELLRTASTAKYVFHDGGTHMDPQLVDEAERSMQSGMSFGAGFQEASLLMSDPALRHLPDAFDLDGPGVVSLLTHQRRQEPPQRPLESVSLLRSHPHGGVVGVGSRGVFASHQPQHAAPAESVLAEVQPCVAHVKPARKPPPRTGVLLQSTSDSVLGKVPQAKRQYPRRKAGPRKLVPVVEPMAPVAPHPQPATTPFNGPKPWSRPATTIDEQAFGPS